MCTCLTHCARRQFREPLKVNSNTQHSAEHKSILCAAVDKLRAWRYVLAVAARGSNLSKHVSARALMYNSLSK